LPWRVATGYVAASGMLWVLIRRLQLRIGAVKGRWFGKGDRNEKREGERWEVVV